MEIAIMTCPFAKWDMEIDARQGFGFTPATLGIII
jgi:hypothetical protein